VNFSSHSSHSLRHPGICAANFRGPAYQHNLSIPLAKTQPLINNLLIIISKNLPGKLFETLVQTDKILIERIISKGHTSPKEGWYDPDLNEWVLVLKGAARLAFEDGNEVNMGPGDSMEIPPRVKHKVVWTDPERDTVWVSVCYE